MHHGGWVIFILTFGHIQHSNVKRGQTNDFVLSEYMFGCSSFMRKVTKARVTLKCMKFYWAPRPLPKIQNRQPVWSAVNSSPEYILSRNVKMSEKVIYEQKTYLSTMCKNCH